MKNNHKIIEIIILRDQHKHISVNKKRKQETNLEKKTLYHNISKFT
jgi:hypothetical protein